MVMEGCDDAYERSGPAWQERTGRGGGCDGEEEGEWLRRRCRHERRLRRLGGGCGDGWRAVVVMEDDTLASGCPAAPVAVDALAMVDWWMLGMMRTLRSTKT